ncbi:hypothetical protein IWZ01DRAFT_486112 [Phyllosticta capitalensis]
MWPHAHDFSICACERVCGFCVDADRSREYASALDLVQHVQGLHGPFGLRQDVPFIEVGRITDDDNQTREKCIRECHCDDKFHFKPPPVFVSSAELRARAADPASIKYESPSTRRQQRNRTALARTSQEEAAEKSDPRPRKRTFREGDRKDEDPDWVEVIHQRDAHDAAKDDDDIVIVDSIEKADNGGPEAATSGVARLTVSDTDDSSSSSDSGNHLTPTQSCPGSPSSSSLFQDLSQSTILPSTPNLRGGASRPDTPQRVQDFDESPVTTFGGDEEENEMTSPAQRVRGTPRSDMISEVSTEIDEEHDSNTLERQTSIQGLQDHTEEITGNDSREEVQQTFSSMEVNVDEHERDSPEQPEEPELYSELDRQQMRQAIANAMESNLSGIGSQLEGLAVDESGRTSHATSTPIPIPTPERPQSPLAHNRQHAIGSPQSPRDISGLGGIPFNPSPTPSPDPLADMLPANDGVDGVGVEDSDDGASTTSAHAESEREQSTRSPSPQFEMELDEDCLPCTPHAQREQTQETDEHVELLPMTITPRTTPPDHDTMQPFRTLRHLPPRMTPPDYDTMQPFRTLRHLPPRSTPPDRDTIQPFRRLLHLSPETWSPQPCHPFSRLVVTPGCSPPDHDAMQPFRPLAHLSPETFPPQPCHPFSCLAVTPRSSPFSRKRPWPYDGSPRPPTPRPSSQLAKRQRHQRVANGGQSGVGTLPEVEESDDEKTEKQEKDEDGDATEANNGGKEKQRGSRSDSLVGPGRLRGGGFDSRWRNRSDFVWPCGRRRQHGAEFRAEDFYPCGIHLLAHSGSKCTSGSPPFLGRSSLLRGGADGSSGAPASPSRQASSASRTLSLSSGSSTAVDEVEPPQDGSGSSSQGAQNGHLLTTADESSSMRARRRRQQASRRRRTWLLEWVRRRSLQLDGEDIDSDEDADAASITAPDPRSFLERFRHGPMLRRRLVRLQLSASASPTSSPDQGASPKSKSTEDSSGAENQNANAAADDEGTPKLHVVNDDGRTSSTSSLSSLSDEGESGVVEPTRRAEGTATEIYTDDRARDIVESISRVFDAARLHSAVSASDKAVDGPADDHSVAPVSGTVEDPDESLASHPLTIGRRDKEKWSAAAVSPSHQDSPEEALMSGALQADRESTPEEVRAPLRYQAFYPPAEVVLASSARWHRADPAKALENIIGPLDEPPELVESAKSEYERITQNHLESMAIDGINISAPLDRETLGEMEQRVPWMGQYYSQNLSRQLKRRDQDRERARVLQNARAVRERQQERDLDGAQSRPVREDLSVVIEEEQQEQDSGVIEEPQEQEHDGIQAQDFAREEDQDRSSAQAVVQEPNQQQQQEPSTQRSFVVSDSLSIRQRAPRRKSLIGTEIRSWVLRDVCSNCYQFLKTHGNICTGGKPCERCRRCRLKCDKLDRMNMRVLRKTIRRRLEDVFGALDFDEALGGGPKPVPRRLSICVHCAVAVNTPWRVYCDGPRPCARCRQLNLKCDKPRPLEECTTKARARRFWKNFSKDPREEGQTKKRWLSRLRGGAGSVASDDHGYYTAPEDESDDGSEADQPASLYDGPSTSLYRQTSDGSILSDATFASAAAHRRSFRRWPTSRNLLQSSQNMLQRIDGPPTSDSRDDLASTNSWEDVDTLADAMTLVDDSAVVFADAHADQSNWPTPESRTSGTNENETPRARSRALRFLSRRRQGGTVTSGRDIENEEVAQHALIGEKCIPCELDGVGEFCRGGPICERCRVSGFECYWWHTAQETLEVENDESKDESEQSTAMRLSKWRRFRRYLSCGMA